jgi:S1-C subfamily serine protease
VSAEEIANVLSIRIDIVPPDQLYHILCVFHNSAGVPIFNAVRESGLFPIDPSPSCTHFPKVFAKFSIPLLLVASMLCGQGAEPERSVIQIMTFSQQPVWDAPWRFEPVRRSGGSGFVIRGKRIMTNAHVVGWGRQIIVRKYQDPRPYIADVEYVGHDCDLAVLKVQETNFFTNLEPLELGELPAVRSTVVTYGYPAGGEEISYTRGVVSRIEMAVYAHIGNRQLLNVQTDAAINPGNSGGPVIQDDRVVGVAFQGLAGLENAGFFIPPPVIKHFLKDIEDQKYDGFPLAGVRMVTLQNPAYRKLLKLPDNDLGARVDTVMPIESTRKVLREEDVILRVGSYPVASDGTILYEGNRVSAGLAYQLAQNGESVPLKVWREGKELDVDLPVFIFTGDRASGSQHDRPPKYYVYGGLVFTPLSLDYLRGLGGNASDAANNDLLYELFYRRHESPELMRSEPVVLASVLPDEVNANMGVRARALVDKVNGIRIENMEDLVKALDGGTNEFHQIEFLPHQHIEALNRVAAIEAKARILKTYSVPSDRRL